MTVGTTPLAHPTGGGVPPYAERAVTGADGSDPSAASAGRLVARWTAMFTLLVVVVVVLGQLSGIAGQASGIAGIAAGGQGWAAMPLGTAVQFGVLAGVVFAAASGWTPSARRLALAALGVAGLTALLGVVPELASEPSVGAGRARLASWLPSGQTALLHVGLGLALVASPRRGRTFGALRTVGLIAAVLVPAASLAAYAFGGAGYVLLPGLSPASGFSSAMTIVMAFGVAAVGVDRWPLQVLIQGPADRVLVGRLLPFILVMPLVGPTLITGVRAARADPELAAVVGSLGPSLILVGLLAVALREHRSLTAELASRDRRLRMTLDALPQAVFLRGRDGTLLHVNPEGVRLITRLGLELADLGAGSSRLSDHIEVVDEAGAPQRSAALPSAAVLRDGRCHDATLGFPLPDGTRAWYAVRAAPVPLSEGITGTVVTYEDVTDRQTARQQTAQAERSLRLTFDHAPVGIALVSPDGTLLQANASLRELLGRDEAQDLPNGFWVIAHPDDHDEDRDLIGACLAGTRDRYLVERRYAHVSGRWIWVQLSVALVRDDAGAPLHFIAQVIDITERRALEDELRAAAIQDPLTGLVNRRALQDRLGQAQRQRAREGGDIGLVYLDVDRFKRINDTYGHEVGDRALVEVARQLTGTTRDGDTVCRIGGDEFVVLGANVDGTCGLRELANRLEALLPVSIHVGSVEVEVGASIGATLVAPGDDLDAALCRADTAMYHAKRRQDASRSVVHGPAWSPAARPSGSEVG